MNDRHSKLNGLPGIADHPRGGLELLAYYCPLLLDRVRSEEYANFGLAFNSDEDEVKSSLYIFDFEIWKLGPSPNVER